MTSEITQMNQELLSSIVLNGDLSKLNPIQLMEYYGYRCKQLGLDPSSQPFDILVLKGRKVLYPKKGCTDQLNKIHKISHQITDARQVGDVYVVSVRASRPDGQFTDSTGAVSITGLKSDDLANAIMKAETKAKRRATISLLGIGMTDESEIETIKEAKTESLPLLTEKQQAYFDNKTSTSAYSLPPEIELKVPKVNNPNLKPLDPVKYPPYTKTTLTPQEAFSVGAISSPTPNAKSGKRPSKDFMVNIISINKTAGTVKLTCSEAKTHQTIKATIFAKKNKAGDPNPLYDEINKNYEGKEATIHGFYLESKDSAWPEPSFIITKIDSGHIRETPMMKEISPVPENNSIDNKDEDMPF